MNRRAAKLGLAPIVLSEVGTDFDLLTYVDTSDFQGWKLVRREEGETVDAAQARHTATYQSFRRTTSVPPYTRRLIHLITVTGTLPRIDGWEMAPLSFGSRKMPYDWRRRNWGSSKITKSRRADFKTSIRTKAEMNEFHLALQPS